MRATWFGIAIGALTLGLAGTAEACVGCGDDSAFFQTASHPFTGRCGWRSVNSTDQGIEATLYGTAVVGDGTGAGVTIRCWLEYSSGTRNGVNVPNTTTQMGAPGSVAVTAKQITVPLGTPTRVCHYAQALFVTPDPPQTDMAPGCSLS